MWHHFCVWIETIYLAIPLMEEILHHLGSIKHLWILGYLLYQLVSRISEPSTVLICSCPFLLTMGRKLGVLTESSAPKIWSGQILLWPKHHDLFAPQKVAKGSWELPPKQFQGNLAWRIWFRERPDWYYRFLGVLTMKNITFETRPGWHLESFLRHFETSF